jgi:iron complex outermembrane receptor protein
MKKIPGLLIAMMYACITVSAQNNVRGKITANITNEKNVPLENATVELLKSKDSSLAKVAITDKNGLAEFDNIRTGTYLAKISFVNYTTQFTSVITVSADQLTIQLPKISLQPGSAEMKEVVVTARKPFIQRLADRLVVNVENSIVSAGSSAMDVLERSPGVSVDQNDVIGLRGRQGVIIMIDGKPTPLTGRILPVTCAAYHPMRSKELT